MSIRTCISLLVLIAIAALAAFVPPHHDASAAVSVPLQVKQIERRAASPNLITRISKTVAGNAGSKVECPAGTLVIGGGLKGSPGLAVYVNNRAQNSWKVKAKTMTGGSEERTVYALCADDVLDVQYNTQKVTVQPNSLDSAAAGCAESYSLVNGGFSYAAADSPANGSIFGSYSINAGTEWQVSVGNSTQSSRKLKSTAICVSSAESNVHSESEEFVVSPGTKSWKLKTADDCASSAYYLLNVGFAGRNFFSTFPTNNGKAWKIAVENTSAGPQNYDLAPMCAELEPS